MLAPDDTRHGTYTGYKNHHCRCFHCRLANHEYRRNKTVSKVDATPAREHFHAWAAATGGGRVRFANLAGLSPTTVMMFANGRRATIYKTTADAALAVPITENPRDCDEVDARPTHRKLRALTAIGWSLKEQSRMLDRSEEWASGVLKKRNVKQSTHDLVDGLYRRLHMTPNPEPALRVRNHARAQQWPPPMAWDDIDNDPAPSDWQYKPTDRATTIRELSDAGENATQIARRLGIKRASLEKWCLRNLPDVWRVIVAREGDWNTTGNAASHTRMGGAA